MQNYSSQENIALLRANKLFIQNFSATSFEDDSVNQKLFSMQADVFIASFANKEESHNEMCDALKVLNQIESNLKEHKSIGIEAFDFEKCSDYKDQEVANKHELCAESKISHFMTFADVAAM